MNTIRMCHPPRVRWYRRRAPFWVIACFPFAMAAIVWTADWAYVRFWGGCP